jgi:error-prone DNA polymerase
MPLDPAQATALAEERVGRSASMSSEGYVELTARSTFSFLRGATPPEALVQRAAELGYDAIAITDCDGLYGAVRAHEEAVKHGVRLVVGCELTIGTSAPFATLTVHVENHTGYTNLCHILTESHRHQKKGKPPKRADGAPRNHHSGAGVSLEYVCSHADGLWALAHVESGVSLPMLKRAFGERLSIAVHRHLDGEDRDRIGAAVAASRAHDVPISATNAVRYAERESKPVYDVIHCIREGITLDRAGRALSPNAEAYLKSRVETGRLFADHPEWLARSRTIADACRFHLKELRYRFPCEIEAPAHPSETPDEALRRVTYAGALDRYGGEPPPKVRAQIEKELALIAKLEVAPYFLSVQSIVEIARAKDILCQGRGSAANSAVCFCMGITAVDPARSNLLFERFLSAERREPPDIDVDFEHERREEVIQEIYLRFGRERAAMVSEVICYRGKSALRDVGKVFGLSLEQVERMSSLVAWWDALEEMPRDRIVHAGFDPDDERVRQVLVFARAIQGFPRHLSIHVGGFVLSAEPLVEVAPIEPATMPDRTVIPWDKDDLDTLGFFKVDVLGLGMLTAIRKTLALVNDDPRISASNAIDRLAKVPPEDTEVYDALCKADTVGVFQIESRAQMAMLPRLLPRTFYDLVVEVAIVRPGPIQGGMIHPYLRRRSGQEAPDSPHPSLDPILARTLGVPLFQEQVMQLAIVGAGYTGGEADQLRRDMAAWRKNGKLERHRQRLHDGFTARGISHEFAERLYQQIQGFGEYGFPESHAASFALLVYASSWLKVHHPAAFAAGLVNSQPMGFYSPSTILQDAEKHGVEIRAVCIEKSDWDCTLEDGAIRIGIRQVRGLGKECGLRIEGARHLRVFTGIEDLAARASLKKSELEALAESGALEPLVRGRRDAIWKVRAPRGPGRVAERVTPAEQRWLFEGKELLDPSPALPALSRTEILVLDYERTGVSVGDHPLKILRPELEARIKTAKELMVARHGTRASAAGMVICRQRPQTASGVVFITMEDETGFINLIMYARVFEDLRHVATTSSLLLAHGKIEREGEVVYIVVRDLEPLRLNEEPSRESEPLAAMSRDFH